MARGLYWLGRLVAAHPVVVLLLWIVGAVGVTLLVHQVGAETSNNLSLPGTGSQAATDLLTREFPPQQNGTNPIIFHAAKGKVTAAANKQAITDSYKAIKKLGFVSSATSPFSQQGQAQLSKDKKTAFIGVILKIGSNELTDTEAQRVMDAAQPGVKAGMQVAGGGSIGSKLSPNDTSTSDIVGILAAMLILTFTFGTLVAMGMPIGTAVLALTTALGVIGLLGHVIAVPEIAHTVATMIGLAVGIDYALFLVTRHRTQMSEGVPVNESIARAVATAGTAVVFAGCTVVVALVSLVVAGIPLVSSLGYTAAVAVAVAVLGGVTLLPALMAIAGQRINSLAIPGWLHREPAPDQPGMWGRWAGFVTARPWIPVVVSALILVPLIIPVSSLHLGQEDIGQTPKTTMERQAYDLMSAGFGVGFNGPLLIASSLHPVAKADPKVTAQENQLKALQKELQAEQKQGNEMKAQLEAGQASLEQQQASLERQQAQLEQQKAALEQQQASLESQKASLEAQAAQLQAEQAQLQAQAAALAADAEKLAKEGAALHFEQLRIESLLKTVTDPGRIRRLERRLKIVEAGEARVRGLLEQDKQKALALQAEKKSLEAQAASLQQQQATLEAQAAQLQAQAAKLQAQAADLQKQADALKAQAAALQAEKQQLLDLQAKAAKQQKQAEALHSQLVATITKAGGDDRGTDPRLVKLQDALTATKGDKLVSPPKLNKSGNAAVYTVIASTAPADPKTANLVKHLRATVIPQNTGKGLVAFVGGSTAGNVDLAAEIASRLPLVIITILLLSMLVLLVAFRSLLIPLQAALTNLLTALAAFGVLTALFQWGWGISLVGIDTTANSVPIASYVPLMMFAVLFGLSMDYQVFLLSSVDHHRAHGEDDRTSVGLGLKLSARVIAAAALIMISVFSSFILNGDPVVKQFGVGLSSAVALAAAMVLMLAPAVLTLLGRWAWWLPAWLGKILPYVDIEGAGLETDDTEPEEEPEPLPVAAVAAEPVGSSVMKVLILGAGFGGLELATLLSETGGGEAFDVTVIDKGDAFVFGYSKLDVMFGRTTLEEVRLPYTAIAKPGVQILQETITAIDPAAKRVTTDEGTHEADVLVVALGADYVYDETPGLLDVNEFYSVNGATELADVLPTFTEGRAVIGVCGAPYKCPPAPSECALLLHDYLTERGLRDACEITIVTPFGKPIPPSPDASEALLTAFAEKGITFAGGSPVALIDTERGVAVSADGTEYPFDLFLGVPKHRAPQVVVDAGMTEEGFIPVASATLESKFPGVYAVGDVATVGVPKAGIFSEGAARIVAQALIHRQQFGDAPAAYDGKGSCYIEFGGGQVGRVDIDFLSGPDKTGKLMPPSDALVTEKVEFGRSRRARWGFEQADSAAPLS